MKSIVDKMFEKTAAEAKAEGRAEGRAEGIAEGKREAVAELVKRYMLSSHKSFDGAADALSIPLDQRPELRKTLSM